MRISISDPNLNRNGAGIRWSLIVLFLCSASTFAGDIDFNSQIRPILSQRCLSCHGPDEAKRESDFRIDTFQEATADLGGYAGIVPGHPAESEVIRRITSDDPDQRMPPTDESEPLTSAEASLLREWIASGARYQRHWAYLPIRKPQVPQPSDLPASATEIDRFIIDALRRAGLRLSPPASRIALIRRATFDLIGLPPTWKNVEAFLDDSSDDAFAKVVDRLLESPRYGERWGRHWLDIARYADTHGGGAIGFKKFAFSYTYRDYVIKAFNGDLPYDRFVLEQVAADQLGLADDDPALAALGFLTVGRQYRNVHDLIDDRIDVVTRGLLGLTVTCARCHNHKYDEIPSSDYYALYATFACSDTPTELPVLGEPNSPAEFGTYKEELARRQLRLTETVREQSDVLRNRLRMQVGEYLRELAKGAPEQDLSTIFLSYRTDDLRPLMIERWRKYLATLTVDDPVFGAWHRLTKVATDEQFERAATDVVVQMEEENGDVSKLNLHSLATQPPRWNPRVLQALKTPPPKSMLDVANAYGKLFASVQEEWLRGVLDASLEARSDMKVIPDDDARHTNINSSVNRQLRMHLYRSGAPTALSDETAATILNRPIRDHVVGLKGAIHDLNLSSPGSPPRAMVLAEDPSPNPFHIFRRGNPIDHGPMIEPRFLTAISSQKDSVKDAKTNVFANGRRRLGLAQAIVDPQNPLTRRVIVNWVWQRHFGLGLVRTPDDFGTRGEVPTHPRLLDFLAEVFFEDGGSIKQLHRRIMLSRVYQQAASEDIESRLRDPENRLLWRMPRRRLELEAMRDAMLAAAGQLDTTMGGRPFDLFAEPFVPRRSVYGFVNRDVIPGFFSTFDMADPSVCVAKRPSTTVPQQTLFALNSAFVQQQAQHLAELDQIKLADTDEQRVEFLYQRAFSRLPTATEIATAVGYIRSQSDNGNNTAWQQLAHVLLAANEFVFVD